VRLGDGLGDGDADWHLDTVGHSHAGGDLDCPYSVHWHLSALTVNLLLTRSGGGGDNTNSRGLRDVRDDGNRSKRTGSEGNTRGDGKRTSAKEELGISLSIGLGLSISLALSDPGGDGVKAESSDQRSNSCSGGEGDTSKSRGASNETSINSNTRGTSNSNGGTSNSDGGTDDGLGGNNLLLDGDSGLELGADLGDDVLALGGEGCLGHSLGLGGALLGLSALLLCGALLLSDGPLHVLALGLSGALGLVTAHLIRHGLAHLLGHLLHDVGTLLLGGGGTLLLGHIPGHGGALLLGVGGALLPGLSPGLGHGGGGTHTLSNS